MLGSVAVVKGEHRSEACPFPVAAAAAADGYLRDLLDPVGQDREVPNLAGTVGAEDTASAVADHRHDLACDGRDSLPDHRLRCSGADQEVVAVLVVPRVASDRIHRGTAAGVNSFLARVVNTAAIEDCVVDMVTSAVDQASLRPDHRD